MTYNTYIQCRTILGGQGQWGQAIKLMVPITPTSMISIHSTITVPNSLQRRYPEKLVLPSILSQFFHPLWCKSCRIIQQQFWMKEWDILGVKTYSGPSYIFSARGEDPNPHHLYAPGRGSNTAFRQLHSIETTFEVVIVSNAAFPKQWFSVEEASNNRLCNAVPDGDLTTTVRLQFDGMRLIWAVEWQSNMGVERSRIVVVRIVSCRLITA